MGTSKTEHFSETQNALAALAKALAHPARIAILEHLAKVNRCICGDLVDELPLAQATVSQHLKELKQVGLICGEIEGTSVCYCLNAQKIDEIRLLFSSFFLCCNGGNSLPIVNTPPNCCG